MSGPEYVTDVPYVRAFEPDLSPSRLRLVAALNGLAPPPADDFDYCELGSAHGDTTATLAAAYPRARFIGVDINADHIASSNKLATRGELENVRFIEADFEDLRDLPPLDFITAHGVVSWVSPEKRRALMRLAAARLKPGGLLMVSYNALPGWAPLDPLRQLLAGRAALASGDSAARAKEAVDFARLMSEHGAEYFTGNPAVQAMLAKIAKLGHAYVAHEYLHAHWCPLYFAQVAAEMAVDGLHFVGQLPLYLNYRDLAVPARLGPVFAGITDRVAFESLKDFALNEYFRRDLFVKGHPPRTEAATRDYLDRTVFGRTLTGEPIPHDLRFPHHTLSFAGPLFDALVPELVAGGGSVEDLARRPGLRAFELPRIRDAVMRLALGEAIVPLLATTKPAVGPSPSDARYRLHGSYNRGALRDGLTLDTPLALASVVAGTGIELTPVEAVALFVLTEVSPGERDAWIHDQCERSTFRLVVRGRAIEDSAERESILNAELKSFTEQRLPRLLELGVVGIEG